ncbi:hypothetical protein NBH00_05340 [Paraconexibacter antarcticus]|uniref:Uncharacterized protein n=1 Tax=Paraconexibacter antarcticus TaxID=2949664 RepID=A0ABY5DVY4_9ACTN|nr:hypothetical protein [Paraconexibacter antarcticus]UTI65635.1 hypothetical protein NBH00_05340 [Paraconexibacter antarcticus]
MPKSAAQTVTDVGSLPTQTSTGPLNIHIVLMFDQGKPFVPSTLLSALTTAYGAGKVYSDKDTTNQNNFVFRITP